MLGDRPEGCTPLPPSWGIRGGCRGFVGSRILTILGVHSPRLYYFFRRADTLLDATLPIGYSWAIGPRRRFYSAGKREEKE